MQININRNIEYRETTDYSDSTLPVTEDGKTISTDKEVEKLLKERAPKVFEEYLDEFNKEMYGETDQSMQKEDKS